MQPLCLKRLRLIENKPVIAQEEVRKEPKTQQASKNWNPAGLIFFNQNIPKSTIFELQKCELPQLHFSPPENFTSWSPPASMLLVLIVLHELCTLP